MDRVSRPTEFLHCKKPDERDVNLFTNLRRNDFELLKTAGHIRSQLAMFQLWP